MFMRSSRQFHSVVLLLLAAVLLAMVGCIANFQRDPAKMVTVVINNVTDEDDADDIKERLKGMTDGSSHMMTATRAGDRMTVKLSPVTDVEKFAEKIDFGKVEVDRDNRTVTVQFTR